MFFIRRGFLLLFLLNIFIQIKPAKVFAIDIETIRYEGMELINPAVQDVTHKGFNCYVGIYSDKKSFDYFVCNVFDSKGRTASTLFYTCVDPNTIEFLDGYTLSAMDGLDCRGKGYFACAVKNVLAERGRPAFINSSWIGTNFSEFEKGLSALKITDPNICDPALQRLIAAGCTPDAKSMLREGYVLSEVGPKAGSVKYCREGYTPIKWINGKAYASGGVCPSGPLKKPPTWGIGNKMTGFLGGIAMSTFTPGGGPIGNFYRRCTDGEGLVDASCGTAKDYYVDEYSWTPTTFTVVAPEVEEFQGIYGTYKEGGELEYNPFKATWGAMFMCGGQPRSEADRCWNMVGRSVSDGCGVVVKKCDQVTDTASYYTGGYSYYLLYPPIYWGIRR